LKEGLASGGTCVVVAKAITDFSAVLSSFFLQWQESNMYQSVDPQLLKSYQELLIKEKISELEEKQSRCMEQQRIEDKGQVEEQHCMEEQQRQNEQRQIEHQQCMEQQQQIEQQ
jgi:hypothetical protein